MIRKLEKHYIQLLKEDVAPYFIKRKRQPGTPKTIYHFTVPAISTDRHIFIELARRYKCWRYIGNCHYTYESTSITMQRIAEKMEVESVEDIPSHMVDAFTFNIDNPNFNTHNTLSGRFKTKKRKKEMKFSAKHSIDIEINDKNFKVNDPVNADKALEIVLELNNRLNFLQDQDKELDSLNDVTNIRNVITDEMDSIKVMIEYINDNIEEE